MVNENYVVRFRSDVLYLLDFERHVKEQFSVAAPVYAKGDVYKRQGEEIARTMH